MRVYEIIDRILLHPHSDHWGLSYGQLTVLFVAYVLYLHPSLVWDVRLRVGSSLCWTKQLGGPLAPKESTVDRLGDLLVASVGAIAGAGCAMGIGTAPDGLG